MIIEFIEEKLQQVLNELNYDLKAKVIVSNRKDLCDYQFDGAFAYAKILHKNPLEISEIIVNEWKKNPDTEKYFAKIEAVRPGFINITLSNQFINETLYQMAIKLLLSSFLLH